MINDSLGKLFKSALSCLLTVNCEHAVQYTLYILLDKNTVVMHGVLSH